MIAEVDAALCGGDSFREMRQDFGVGRRAVAELPIQNSVKNAQVLTDLLGDANGLVLVAFLWCIGVLHTLIDYHLLQRRFSADALW